MMRPTSLRPRLPWSGCAIFQTFDEHETRDLSGTWKEFEEHEGHELPNFLGCPEWTLKQMGKQLATSECSCMKQNRGAGLKVKVKGRKSAAADKVSLQQRLGSQQLSL